MKRFLRWYLEMDDFERDMKQRAAAAETVAAKATEEASRAIAMVSGAPDARQAAKAAHATKRWSDFRARVDGQAVDSVESRLGS